MGNFKSKLIKSIPSNYHQEKVLNTIVPAMKAIFFMPEEEIVYEGEEAENFYFVIQGECLLNIKDENNNMH